MRRRAVCALLGAVLLGTLSVWIWRGNSVISVSAYTVCSDRLPPALSGLHIAQVSDLHGAVFGARNEALLRALREARPDLIAVTGDLIDSYRTGRDPDLWQGTAETVLRMTEIAPVYYVTGNHEWASTNVPRLKGTLAECGVTVLSNQYTVLERNGDSLVLAGVDDPNGYADQKTPEELYEEILQGEGEGCVVLLAHRNDRFDQYAAAGYDLVISGHGHGGIVRLPFTDGLLGTDRRLFPTWTAGVYTLGESTLFVSRGLGNNTVPIPGFRLFNRPDLAVLELTAREAGA